MGSLTLYAIKSSLTLALLYLPYALLMRRDTLFRMNRAMLLGIVVVSLTVPCLDLHIWDNTALSSLESQQEALRSVTLPALVVGVSDDAAMPSSPSPRGGWSGFVLLYIIGMLAVLVWKAVGLVRLARFIPSGCLWTDRQEGATIYCHAGPVSPFSWMRSIVVSEETQCPVMQHELAHVHMGHSWDILLLSLVEALQWFNPCVWMLDASLREVHEYEADDAVLRRGISAREYQLLLIEKAVAQSRYPMVNGFNHSLLKNRITMMTKPRTPKWARLKVLYAVPLTLLAVGAFASQEFTNKVEAPIVPQTESAIAQQGQRPASSAKKMVQVKPGTLRLVVDGQEMTVQEAMNAVRGKEIQNAVTPQPDGSTELQITTSAPEPTDKKPYLLYIDNKNVGTIENVEALRNGYGEIRLADIANIAVTPAYMAKQIYKDAFDETKAKGVISIITKKDKEAAGTEMVTLESLVFDVPDASAEFPGDIYAWLGQNIKYPKEAKEQKIEGRVSIQFVIEKDGSIAEVKPLRSPSELLSAEAMRVVKAMPKWKPAKVEGKPVRMRYVLPVLFKIPAEQQATTIALGEAAE